MISMQHNRALAAAGRPFGVAVRRGLLLAFVLVFLTTGLVSAQEPPAQDATGEQTVAQKQQRSPEALLELAPLANSKPFQRMWWNWHQRAYPSLEIPSDARERALDAITTWQSRQPATEGGGAPLWTSIGPSGINVGGGIQYSGRTADVAIDPTNNDRWLIGGAQGGIWETTDAGDTWTPLTDDKESLAMGAISFAPSNPMIVYAGTGESAFSGDAYGGAGILKSTDGGATWTLIANATFDERSFADIAIDPTDPDTLVVATSRGLIGSFSGSTSMPVGIFKSTDGGTSWNHNLSGDDATDLEFDAANFDRQYAGIGEIFGSPSNGVYRSTDAGDSWTLVPGPWDALGGGIGRVEMAIAPSDPNTLYVSIQDAIDGAGADAALLGLWVTTDAWAATPTFTSIATGAASGICGGQCWYDHELKVDPADSTTLFAGGVSLWRRLGGAWSNISGPSSVHVDQHSMAFAGTKLVVGNDGGVWSSTDGGNTFSHHNDGLTLTQFYHGSQHATDPAFAIGGSQDNGTEIWSGTDIWTIFFGADGADNVISALDPDQRWAISIQFQQIFRTTNGGASVVGAGGGLDGNGAPFIGVFAACTTNDDVFIAGLDNLWRSDNFFSGGSAFWTSNGPEEGSGVLAMDFAAADASCDTYAYGVANGAMKITQDGGSTWTDLDPSGQIPDRRITDVAFDPADANVLYVTISGFGPEGHLFRSDNALSASPTWTEISPPIDTPHNTVVAAGDGNLYVGTDFGVWVSNDDGANWAYEGPADGLPNVVIYDLQYSADNSQLIAFTHGRGAFTRAVSTPIFTDGFESGDTTRWSSTTP